MVTKYFKIDFEIFCSSDCVSATKHVRPILTPTKGVVPSFKFVVRVAFQPPSTVKSPNTKTPFARFSLRSAAPWAAPDRPGLWPHLPELATLLLSSY